MPKKFTQVVMAMASRLAISGIKPKSSTIMRSKILPKTRDPK